MLDVFCGVALVVMFLGSIAALAQDYWQWPR